MSDADPGDELARPIADAPTAPGRLPGIGHALPLLRDVPTLLRACAADRSSMHLLSFPFFFDMYLWSEPEALGLLARKGMSNAETARFAKLLLGEGSMLSTDGPEHRRRRGSANQAFTPKGLSMNGTAAVISEVVERRVEAMLAREQVLMLDETQGLALEILFRMLGVPEQEVGAWARRYGQILSSVIFPKLDLPGSPYRRGLAARRWIDERLGRYIQQAKDESGAGGLIAAILAGRDDEGRGLDGGETLDNLRLLVVAGHETTASVMAWIVDHLGRSPELYARLLAEAQATPGLPHSAKQMSQFPLAEALFREVLRLHPPLAIASRRTREPMTLGGYELPADTLVGIPLWLFNRDPEAFPEPDRFWPDRWLREQRRLSAIEMSAFGGGPHFCLGYHMALLEGVQFALALVRGLDAAGKRLEVIEREPRASYMPMLRPKLADTRTRFVPA